MLTLLVRLELSENTLPLPKHVDIIPTRDPNKRKWDSHVLSRPLNWYEDATVLCVHFHILFRTKVKKGYLNKNNFHHCYSNFLESVILRGTCSKFLLKNYEVYWQQYFEYQMPHLLTEDNLITTLCSLHYNFTNQLHFCWLILNLKNQK